MTYRPDIDGLRAIAVLSVLFYHAGFAIVPGGFVGVDVFFVISGYLITKLIYGDVQAGRFSFANFYARRIRRLFPALLFTLVVAFVGGFLLFDPQQFTDVSASVISSAFSFSNVFFWLQSGYFDTGAMLKPLLHTWSLSVEEQFYLVWPAILILLLTRTGKYGAPAFLLVASVASLIAAEWFMASHAEAVFFLTPFRIFEFGIGGALVWIEHRRASRPALEALAAIGFVLVLYPVFSYSHATTFPGVTALIPCLGAGLLIYAGQAPVMGSVLRSRVMVWVGLVSYSLYLIHWPVIVFYNFATSAEPSAVAKLGMVLVSVAASVLMYRYIEQPFRTGRLRLPALSQPRLIATGLVSAALVCLPAAGAWSSGGWLWRVGQPKPPSYLVHEAERFRTDWHRELAQLAGHSGAIGYGSQRDDARTALIIGDSHAGHLVHLADYIGKKYNVSFTLSNFLGCPPVFGTHKIYGTPDGRLADRQEKCREQIEFWGRMIDAVSFDYVVLASRWDWMFEDTDYGNSSVRRDFMVDNANPIESITASRATFEKYLPRTIDRIVASGAHPIVFSQVPLLDRSVSKCGTLPNYLPVSNHNTPCAGVPRSKALARLAFADRVIAAQAESGKATAVIPSRYFCPPAEPVCTALVDGLLLYQDRNHVNEYGSIFLAKAWENDPDFPFSTPTDGVASGLSAASRPLH